MHDIYHHVKAAPKRGLPSRSSQLRKAKAALQKKAQAEAESTAERVDQAEGTHTHDAGQTSGEQGTGHEEGGSNTE